MTRFRYYQKPILMIVSLNIAMVGLIFYAWKDLKAEARTGLAGVKKNFVAECGNLHLPPSRGTRYSPLELKSRALEVFRAERESETPDHPFLYAMASALQFGQYERLEQLLNEYHCGHKL